MVRRMNSLDAFALAVIGFVVVWGALLLWGLNAEFNSCNPIREAVEDGASPGQIAALAAVRLGTCDLPEHMANVTRSATDEEIRHKMWLTHDWMSETVIDEHIVQLRVKYGEAYP